MDRPHTNNPNQEMLDKLIEELKEQSLAAQTKFYKDFKDMEKLLEEEWPTIEEKGTESLKKKHKKTLYLLQQVLRILAGDQVSTMVSTTLSQLFNEVLEDYLDATDGFIAVRNRKPRTFVKRARIEDFIRNHEGPKDILSASGREIAEWYCYATGEEVNERTARNARDSVKKS